ncbi:DUF986 family protein [Celerinatantimonas sp. YJH-8]|uniref:DUF986 family protein n=1 Tax=Celerinatantimonas sp. YJH-8 TaxID=3228714 RepID=UPI0038C11A6B
MTFTNIGLIVFIVLLFGYAIYDEWIMPRRKGTTLLRIKLLRKTRLDSLIFVALIAILLYQNIASHGSHFTTYLLTMIGVMSIYLAFIRHPKLLFKSHGFFFANAFIDYKRIKTMNLSEDGVLVFGLDSGQLPIELHNIDDLDKITELFDFQKKPQPRIA